MFDFARNKRFAELSSVLRTATCIALQFHQKSRTINAAAGRVKGPLITLTKSMIVRCMTEIVKEKTREVFMSVKDVLGRIQARICSFVGLHLFRAILSAFENPIVKPYISTQNDKQAKVFARKYSK